MSHFRFSLKENTGSSIVINDNLYHRSYYVSSDVSDFYKGLIRQFDFSFRVEESSLKIHLTDKRGTIRTLEATLISNDTYSDLAAISRDKLIDIIIMLQSKVNILTEEKTVLEEEKTVLEQEKTDLENQIKERNRQDLLSSFERDVPYYW